MTVTLRRWTSPMRFTYANDARPVDGFTIRRGIHRGGFGEVYYAVSDAGKEVALKLLTHDLDTELRGVRQCLNLKHPNLVTIFDVKTDGDGDHWVVMEYVKGSNLEEILTAFPQGLPIGEVRDWMHGLVAGVEYLHDRGLIHRDLKPANIYRENGVVKVGDVGLSKRFDGERRHQHTESIGTVYYMAPEITHGKYGPAVDVYSLGIILYELLTGRLPFNGETSGEILMKQLSAAPDLSVIPPNIRPVLARALEKDPQKRTSSARRLLDEFEQSLSPATAIPESHFVNGNHYSPPRESARRDTDKSRDTSRRYRVPVQTPGSSPSPNEPSLSRQAGRLVGRTKLNRSFTWVVIAVAIWASFIPWQRMNIPESAPIAVAGIAVVSLVLWLRRRWRTAEEGPPNAEASLKPVAVAAVLPPPPPKPKPDWFGSLATGSLASICFSALALTVWINLDDRSGILERPDLLVFFTAVSVVGTWMVVGCRWLAEKSSFADAHSRLLHAAAGIILATAAADLSSYMMVSHLGLNDRQWGRAINDHLGVNELLVNQQPTWVGYCVFFAGMFFLLGNHLVKIQKPGRKRPWMLRQMIFPIVIAIIWVHVFTFPQLAGILWAATIVSAVQFASPWQPTVKSTNKR